MKDSNILIYTMGRVGSVAVRKALQRRNIESFHVHYLFYKNGEPGFGGPRWNEAERMLDKTRPIKVITLIRDPMYRSISSWALQKKAVDLAGMSIEQARRSFLAENRMWYTLKWFDNELSKLVGLSFLGYLNSTSFRLKKWDLSVHKNVEVLALRTSHLDYRSAEISQFVRMPVQVERQNVSMDRPGFAEEYERILSGLKFSKDFVEEVYSSSLVKSSFNENEIAEMKENWL